MAGKQQMNTIRLNLFCSGGVISPVFLIRTPMAMMANMGNTASKETMKLLNIYKHKLLS